MATGVQIKGFKQLDRAMKKLGGPLSFKISKKAAGFSLTKVLKRAKALAPKADEDGGTLREALGKKTIANKVKALANTLVGIKSGFKSSRKHGRRNPQQYAHLIELGTRHKGARSFVRRAFISLQDDVLKRYREKFKKELEKEVRKLPKGPT